MRGLYLLSVVLHVLAAVVWLGGMLGLALALVPTLRRPEFRGVALPLVGQVGLRLRPVGWICLALLAATGVYQVAWRVGVSAWCAPAFWASGLGRLLAAKLVLFAAVVGLSAVHDFWIGPRALVAPADESPRWRRRAAFVGRANALLGVLLVGLGVVVVRGGP